MFVMGGHILLLLILGEMWTGYGCQWGGVGIGLDWGKLCWEEGRGW